MRILLLSNKSPWPPKDGGSSATLGLIRGLSGSGAEITVLAFNTLRHFIDYKYVKENIGKNTDIQLVDLRTGINHFSLLINFIFSSKPYNIYRFSSEGYREKLAGLLENKFDIIQVEGLAMTIYTDLIRKSTSGRLVYRPHNVENMIWSQLSYEPGSFLRKIYFRSLASRLRKYETAIMNRFDAVVPISHADLNWFKSSGLAVPAIVIPSGIFNTAPAGDPPDDMSVFFIGALDWLPNISGLKWFISKVWPLIAGEESGASFHIAGRNCSDKTALLFKTERVVFHGEVESSSSFINAHSVMVVPLFAGSGLRIKIIEGMSAGKSIVATPVAVSGTTCENGRDLFVESEPGKFAARVLSLLRNRKLRNETGSHAMDNVSKNYNILAAANSLLKFYSKQP